jgi:hypothetical protein
MRCAFQLSARRSLGHHGRAVNDSSMLANMGMLFCLRLSIAISTLLAIALASGCKPDAASPSPAASETSAGGSAPADAATEPAGVRDASPQAAPDRDATGPGDAGPRPSSATWHEWRDDFDSVTVYRLRRSPTGSWERVEQIAKPPARWGHRVLEELAQLPEPGARHKRCLFTPGIDVEYRKGEDTAVVRLCFACGDVATRLPHERDFGPLYDFEPRQRALESLMERVLPGVDLEPLSSAGDEPLVNPFAD